MTEKSNDIIVALATPPGIGGIGVIRLSGPGVDQLCIALTRKAPQPRIATLSHFYDIDGKTIDQGLSIFFRGPNSYTGEDVLEIQGHGSPVVAQMLIKRCVALGARMARPGEFSERAFLSGQLDLAQAEAVADLIESSTEAAARSAMNALQGKFSEDIHHLVAKVTHLRIYVEAAIDFPDEEIDFLGDQQVIDGLQQLQDTFTTLRQSMRCGKLLRDGLRIVLNGKPNVGKSSLLNLICKDQRAIVTDIPGTTRDTLEQHIDLDGLPVVMVDTAGIRQSDDLIEAEGVRRALEAKNQADLVLHVVECGENAVPPEAADQSQLVVVNKIDLYDEPSGRRDNAVFVCAKSGAGLLDLIEAIKEFAGFRQTNDSQYIARQRHIDALERAQDHVDVGVEQLKLYQAGELLAEELRLAQNALGEITGVVTSDDLLGHIFSSFCIGK